MKSYLCPTWLFTFTPPAILLSTRPSLAHLPLSFLSSSKGGTRSFTCKTAIYAASHNSHSENWTRAKNTLRSPKNCVVSVSGLETYLSSLRDIWKTATGDLDLRARIRVRASAHTRADCLAVCRSVRPLLPLGGSGGRRAPSADGEDPCALVLEELARGVASLADGPLGGVVEDVFVRVAFASNYAARDPMFHTDKAPIRGYVTLDGPGTDYMTRPCSPLEYMKLRGLGAGPGASGDGDGSGGGVFWEDGGLRRAEELEFIVMKGDYYEAPVTASSANSSWFGGMWKRTSACVHRSPIGDNAHRKRIIVSFDLADGDDDREWEQANLKRSWRSGMTQRKSRLVA